VSGVYNRRDSSPVCDRSTITIISGGQTGADRAALDFALESDISHGGWCPRGRLAEDGPIPHCYQLQETPSRKYAQRTEWNVRDSDATVVFTTAAHASGGTALALEFARRLNRPSLHLSSQAGVTLEKTTAGAAAALQRFLADHNVRRLNVAGPRGSQEPAIGKFVRDVLQQALCG
jgi:hypothetical protein